MLDQELRVEELDEANFSDLETILGTIQDFLDTVDDNKPEGKTET